MLVYNYDKQKQKWFGVPLQTELDVGLDAQKNLTIGSDANDRFGAVRLVALPKQKERAVLLLQQNRGIKLNGLQPFSVTVLRHKDELSYGGQTVYFSMEHPVRVVRFDEGNHGHINCPRCKDKIAGESVQCPKCGLWFHESKEDSRQCWSYDKKCICGYPTDFKDVWKPKPIKPKTNWKHRYVKPK